MPVSTAAAAIIGAVVSAGSAAYSASQSRKGAKSQAEAALEASYAQQAAAHQAGSMQAAAAERQAQAMDAAAKRQAAAMIRAAEIGAAAQREAAEKQLEFQQKGLNYLIKSEKLPMQYRDSALGALGELYALSPGKKPTTKELLDSPFLRALAINQEETIEKAKGSPLYESLMGAKSLGEDAIMRKASATGGLRSGNVNYNLYDYNTQYAKEALVTAYDKTYNEELEEKKNLLTAVAGITGLANYKGNSPEVANMYNAMGATAGAGIRNAGMTEAAGISNAANARASGEMGAASARASGENAYANSVMAGANAASQGQYAAATARNQGNMAAANAYAQGAQNIGNSLLTTGLGGYMKGPAADTGANPQGWSYPSKNPYAYSFNDAVANAVQERYYQKLHL